MLMLIPLHSSSWTYAELQYWTPRSEWCMRRHAVLGGIDLSAISNACSGYMVSRVGPTAQPTILREYASVMSER